MKTTQDRGSGCMTGRGAAWLRRTARARVGSMPAYHREAQNVRQAGDAPQQHRIHAFFAWGCLRIILYTARAVHRDTQVRSNNGSIVVSTHKFGQTTEAFSSAHSLPASRSQRGCADRGRALRRRREGAGSTHRTWRGREPIRADVCCDQYGMCDDGAVHARTRSLHHNLCTRGRA